MNNLEIENLLKDLKGQIDKVEWWIGKDKSTTTRIADHILSIHPTTPLFLQACSLLLLEKYDSVVGVIRDILRTNPEDAPLFIKEMSLSPYYYQRMAVPSLIVDSPLYKDTLLKCLQDSSGVVIREAAKSIGKYKTPPLNEEELLEVAMNLNNHQYDYVQCTVPEVLVHLKNKTFLVSDVCMSKSWRKRLSIANRVGLFPPQERETIFSLLHKDVEEAVRLSLVQNLQTVEDPRVYTEIFLRVPCERVRGEVIRAVGNLNEYQDILRVAVEDSSWVVRKELLCIHNENIYESISLPLISSLPSLFDWRIKVEILESISQIALKNPLLIRKCLTETLFLYLSDKVYEIRERTGGVIKEIVEKEEWTREWEERISRMVYSKDYLKRMSVCQVAVSFDKRFSTSYTRVLLRDKIPNVRLKTLSYLKRGEEIIREMMEDDDEYIKEEIKRLIV